MAPPQNHNISSDAAEQGEIDKIAAELRGRLKHEQAVEEDGSTQILLRPNRNGPAVEEVNDDTIYIDREGTLHTDVAATKAEPAKTATPASS
jgi:hypothetical protein